MLDIGEAGHHRACELALPVAELKSSRSGLNCTTAQPHSQPLAAGIRGPKTPATFRKSKVRERHGMISFADHDVNALIR